MKAERSKLLLMPLEMQAPVHLKQCPELLKVASFFAFVVLPLGALLQVALPQTRSPVLVLAGAISLACLHPALCLVALTCWLDFRGESQTCPVTMLLSDDQHCQGTCPSHRPCPAPLCREHPWLLSQLSSMSILSPSAPQ